MLLRVPPGGGQRADRKPLSSGRSSHGRRANAHHNPMEPYARERRGFYRPTLPARVPRAVPDAEFNEIFARLPSHRDRALVAFYISTGARASELLSATQGGVDPGRQLITLIRKGTREAQELPASTDSFVWLRLYQLEMEGVVPKGARKPLRWTSRTPVRPLTYHAVHRMFERTGKRAGSFRHTARTTPYRGLSDGGGPERAPRSPDRCRVTHRSNAAVGHGREGLTAGMSSGADPWRRRPTRR